MFEIEGINRAPAAFNMDKLLWINQHYITNMETSKLVNEVGKRMNARGIRVCNGPGLTEVVEVMRERVQTLEEMVDSINYLYCPLEQYDDAAVSRHVTDQTPALLAKVATEFERIEVWEKENISAAIKQVVADEGVKFPHIAQPLRITVSGSVSTPSIDITLKLMGKKRTLERIEKALKFFSKST